MLAHWPDSMVFSVYSLAKDLVHTRADLYVQMCRMQSLWPPNLTALGLSSRAELVRN